MRILALQPWNDGSHARVRDSIDRHSVHDWTWFTLPGREVRWRMRLGGAQLVSEVVASNVLDEGFDALFCTSLLDVAQVRSLLPGRHRDIPIILYMHENQLMYPSGPRMTKEQVERDGHLAATNVSSLLAADRVIFNSSFNMESCLGGIPEFLSHSQIRYPVIEWQESIRRISSVCWPPVEPIPVDVLRNTEDDGYQDSSLVGWPHRFEHDKGPDELRKVFAEASVDGGLRFSLFGQRYARVPEPIERIRVEHESMIECDQWFESRQDYLKELSRCGWVLSTARHEFFGIAVVEALFCGCLPWLPMRLSYPEILPEEAHGISPMDPPDDPVTMREKIRTHLEPARATNAVARLDCLLSPP